MTSHDVVFSLTRHGEDRYICRTCNNAEVVWYKFMKPEQWAQEHQAFRQKHPYDYAPQVFERRREA